MKKIPFAAAIILAIFCYSYAGEKNKDEEAFCFTTKDTENPQQKLEEVAKLKKEGKLKKADFKKLGIEEIECNRRAKDIPNPIAPSMDMPSMDKPENIKSKPMTNHK